MVYVAGTPSWNETVTGSGWSIPSGYTETSRVYYPDCGHNHGELVEAVVAFN